MGDRRYEWSISGLVLACGAAAVLIQYSPWAPGGFLKGFLSFAVFLVVWIPTGLWYAGRVRRTA